MRHRFAALFVWLAACGPVAVEVDAPLDASPPAVDARLDAGSDAPPPSPFCRPCRRDADCGAGAFCTLFDDRSWACVVACGSDAECSGLSLPSTCASEEPGFPLGCRPTAGSCIASLAGAPCGDDGCAGTHDVCAEPEPGLGAYCTNACDTDADCPLGLRRCGDFEGRRVCVRDPASGPERCAALLSARTPTSCTSDGDCGTGRCLEFDGERTCFPASVGGACPVGERAVEHEGSPICVPDARDPATLALPDCACVAHDSGLIEEAAALAGRDRCALHFPHGLLDAFPAELSHDVMRLSAIDGIHSDWLAPPALAQSMTASLDGAAGDPLAMLLAVAPRADLRVPRSVSAPVATDAAAALRALVLQAGGEDTAEIDTAVAGLSPTSAAALAGLFVATEHALTAREAAVAPFAAAERATLFTAPSALFLPTTSRPAVTRTLIGAMRGDVDVSAMASAAAEILAAAEAVDATGASGLGALRIETPRGTIVLGAASDDVVTIEAALLVVDAGGDDTYVGPVGGTASIDNGVSVILDLGGADHYRYAELPVAGDVGPEGHARLPSDAGGRAAPAGGYGPYSLSMSSRQGAGRLGIGIAVDRGVENDEYRSLRMSQGYGALGVGVLFDEGGDDVYLGEAGVQGAAVAGLGIAIDGGGTDRWVTYHASQGFAFTRGVGVLVDVAGNDDYLAHPSDVLYFSPQSPGASNSSFSQGVGFGRRDDAGGTYMSGGIGILRDRAGDDRYRCGIFCQASAYWYGVGMLLEAEGADHYDGEWYCQAGDAHFAVAVLLDGAGDDTFNETAIRRNASVGGGHDFSSAWLIDLSGDDVYRAPNLALGVGHAGGFGAFVDGGGTDAYDVTSDLSFGNASIETPGDPARRMSGTVGLFVDRGGTDTYVRPTIAPVANDATWTQAAHDGESEAGAGIDRVTGTLGAGLD